MNAFAESLFNNNMQINESYFEKKANRPIKQL